MTRDTVLPPHVSRLLVSRIDPYRLLLLLGILIYAVVFTGLAFDFHAGMRTHRSDLGQIDQAVWNSSRGRFLENTDNGYIATRMTDHVEPILMLISPLFWVWNDVRSLLLLQVLVIAGGAWPLYELTLHKLNQPAAGQEGPTHWQLALERQITRPVALALSLAYLLAPQLQSAVLTEFHAAPLAAPLVLWALWTVETRRMAQFVLAALLLAAVKEETALLAAGLGVWAMWRFALPTIAVLHKVRRDDTARTKREERKMAFLLPLAVVVLSLAWFMIATFIIVPAHAVEVYGVAESGYFARYGALGDSPLDIFKSFFTQPGLVWQIATEPVRITYLTGLLAPFGFFSLLAPEIVLLSLPLLLANLLSAYPAQYYGEFHYSAPLVPYAAASAAYGVGRLWRWLKGRTRHASPGFQHLPAAGMAMMTFASFVRNANTAIRPVAVFGLILWIAGWSVATYGAAGRGPLGGRYDPTPVNEHHHLLSRFMAQIPANAAVTATAAVHPHVSHRRYIYQFPLGLDAPTPAEWALLDVTTNTDMAPGDLKAEVTEMLAGEWGVVDAADGFLLLRKGATEKEIPPAFFDFARTSMDSQLAGEPATPGQAQTILPLRDWSFAVAEDWPRWRQTRLVATLWGVQEGFEPARDMPTFVVVTPDGERIEPLADASPPALVWWKTAGGVPSSASWRITTLPLYLPRVWAIVMNTPPETAGNKNKIQSLDSALAVMDIMYRDAGHHLHAVSWQYLENDNLGGLVHQVAGSELPAQTAAFQWHEDQVMVTVWLPTTVSPGQPLDLWLQWQLRAGTPDGGAPEWPDSLTPFVHLRQAQVNRGQADGPLRFFLTYDVADWLNEHTTAPDWRVIPVPADAPAGETWQVVIGLYDPQTGQRAGVLDPQGNVMADEFIAGQVMITPSRQPDQTCALIPATCASQ